MLISQRIIIFLVASMISVNPSHYYKNVDLLDFNMPKA